jgi:filamentous hemagglutinin family protein
MNAPSLRQLLLGSVSLAILPAGFARAQSLPRGGAYVAGAGSIATAGNGVTINQSSARGIVNWQSFSIGAGNKVQVNNGSGATLNRVTGGNLSRIEGQLSATGSVYVINPSGVVVGPNGRVVTGGSFVASTRDVANGAFMAGGTQTFSGTSTGTVTNAGKIVSQGGDVVLIGEAATNTGAISAPNGTAALAAGTTVVLSAASGPGGIYVAPDPAAKGDATNSGRIKAAAAELASAGGNVYALSGNRAGLIQATGIKTIDGQVWLTAPGGATTVSGTVTARNADGAGGTIVANGKSLTVGATARLSASATGAGKAGGAVLVGVSAPGGVNEAASTTVASGARILATGKGSGAGGHIETSGGRLSIGAATVNAGAGGTWLLDPYDLTIDAAAASTIATSLNAGTNVSEVSDPATGTSGSGVQTVGQGNVTVAAPISWTGTGVLTLNAFNSVNINAAITIGGAGGLVVNAGTGTVNFNGGSVSYTQGAGGSLSINGNAYTLVFDLATLGSDIAANPGGYYALGASINAAGTTYTTEPVNTPLTGTFEGLGNTISNLTINSADPYVGLFAQLNGGTIRDIGIVGGSVTGTSTYAYVGGLVGYVTGGTIVGAYATGSVTLAGADGTGASVGGLVGGVNGGTIAGAYATGSVTIASATGGGASAGGLVGSFSGSAITNSYATGSVTSQLPAGLPGTVSAVVGGLVGEMDQRGATLANSYATGSVSGSGYLGGLVGDAYGLTITNVYATGAVTVGAGGAVFAGGLIGNSSFTTLTNAYATGAVQGSGQFLGGLIGFQQVGSDTNVYAAGPVNGAGAVVGGLIGGIDPGTTVTNGYWNIDRSGVSVGIAGTFGGGGTGLSGASPFTAASYGGFNFTATPGAAGNAWVIVDADGSLNNAGGAAGATMPMLASEYATSIVNAHQLQLMAMAPAASYTLGANIAAAATGSSTSATTGADVWGPNGFVPVGNGTTNFSGGFDGAGHTINNLTVKSNLDAGLFGDVGTATIQNVGLVGGSVMGGNSEAGNVGGLVGYTSGTITNAYTTGTVINNYTNGDTGGLVGYDKGSITGSYATGTVFGGDQIGGLAGTTYGAISNSYATGAVNAAASTSTSGGLIGFAQAGGSIANSYATGAVTGGTLYVGGLIGRSFSSVTGSYATGAVSGTGNVGGLVGLYSFTTVSNSYATGTVTGSGEVGGLVGYGLSGSITGSYATGNVTALGASSDVGGLVGLLWGNADTVTVGNSYATGSVTASGASSNVGGLTGSNFQTAVISASTASGNVIATGAGSNVGGLSGYNDTSTYITGSDATGAVTGSGNVGGLLGETYNLSLITSSYATGTVAGGTSGNTGGLIGYLYYNSTVIGSYATGNVSGGGNVGGLVGLSQAVVSPYQGLGSIATSYATGTVTGTGSVGGLVGTNTLGTITGSYATGAVSNTGSAGSTGGLAGNSQGTISASNAIGAVTSLSSATGGLVGTSSSSITNSYATGAVTNGSGNTGGLVGYTNSAVSGSHATGNVTVSGRSNVGGLVGLGDHAPISGSYATGTVNGTGSVGGLMGYLDSGTVSGSYATGAVTGGGSGNIGGLIGTLIGTVSGSYATGVVSGTGSVGGLVGSNAGGMVTGSYANGAVTGVDSGYFGGLVGTNYGQIANSYATGTVSYVGISAGAGGLAGFNLGTITNSYATGAVSANGGANAVGGLVGENGSVISNSYATGAAVDANTGGTAARGTYVGGLVGYNAEGSSIAASYSAGPVIASGDGAYAGGLVGSNSGFITSSYWDIDRALTSVGVGSGDGTGATGLSGAAVFNAASYVGFTFTATPGATGNAWAMVDLDGTLNGGNGGTLPMLASEYATTIVNAHQLQLMAMAPSAGYTLANNIDATATGSAISPATGADVWGTAGFVPVGTAAMPFSRSLEGNNFLIGGLTINSAATAVGLFGFATGQIQDVGLIGGSVTGTATVAGVGALAGSSSGQIKNAYAMVPVTGAGAVGGLVGVNAGLLTGAYSTGAVTGTSASAIGGLVGVNASGFSTVIRNAYATGAVTGSSTVVNAGGLVGSNNALIQFAYATGAVTSPGAAAGGLIGTNNSAVSFVYATGAVSGGTASGGLAGVNSSSIANAAWNIDRTNQTSAIGMNVGGGSSAGTTGLSAATASPFTAASYPGFAFTATPGLPGNAWVIVDVDGTLNNAGGAAGATMPMLASEYSTSIVNAHQLQLIAMAPGESYTLATNIDASATGTGKDVWGGAGFAPLGGNGAANFTGSFNGQGNAISGLTINFVAPNTGLFGVVGPGGTVANVGLLNAAVSGTMQPLYAIGALIGTDQGAVSNVYATGAVSANAIYAGGLIGYLDISGTVTNSYATDTVSVATGSGTVGGLIGRNFGSISNVYATGAVFVSGTGFGITSSGGLVGLSDGQINNAYATGTVSGPALQAIASPLVLNGIVTNGYYDVSRDGNGHGSRGTALAGQDAFTASSYAGFNFTSTPGTQGNAWVIVDVDGSLNNANGAAGATLPMLASEYNASNIVNAHQLQLLAMAPGASYTLGANIDASATGSSTSYSTGTDVWGSAGFAPIGGAAFTGALNGHGYAINGLVINSSAQNVGLFGTNNGVVRNLVLAGGAITGSLPTGNIGALAGTNGGLIETATSTTPVTASATGPILSRIVVSDQGAGNALGGVAGLNTGAVLNVGAQGSVTDNTPGSAVGGAVGVNNGAVAQSYAVGAVTGATADTSNGNVGGLVGTNDGTVTLSYAAASTTGGTSAIVGGLVGDNEGTLLDAYATGAVSGDPTNGLGGLVGLNDGAITTTYATGVMTPVNGMGGLVGVNTGTVTGSFWDETTTGAFASAAGTGLATRQFLAQGPIATGAFDTSIVWVAGYAYPVLRALPYVLVTATGTQVYGATSATTAVTGATDQNGANAGSLVNTAGTAFLTSATASSPVAGNPYVLGGTGGTVPVGYQLTYTGALTVTPAPLTVTGVKAYDSTTGFLASQLTVAGAANNETITLTAGSGTAAGANVGAYAGGTLTGLAIAVTGGNAMASNYTLPGTGTLTIAPEPITIAAAPNTKTYDGTTTAAAAPTVTVGTIYDTATLSETYATPNAATGLTLTPNAVIANAGNYGITYAPSTAGIINPAPLTVSGSKIYDSATGFALSQLSILGGVNGESVSLTAGSGATSSANAGAYAGGTLAGLAIAVTGGNALASNYALPGTGALTITPEPITIAAAPNSKTYDGTTTAAATPTVISGTLYDTATLSESYATANVGTGLTLNPTATTANAGNYSFTYAPSMAGSINPASLTVTGGKIYDATTGFALSQLAVSGGVNGETISLTAGSGTAASANVGAYAGGTLAGLAIAVTGGNALASNYALPATGMLTITPEAITIAAAPNGKIYDGTTTAAATPTVTSGTLYDTATLSESYATPNAGTGLTLTPTATIADAGNYSITYATSTAGIISPATLTAGLAGTVSKTYDGTTAASLAPGNYTLAGVIGSDSVTLNDPATGTYATANAGTGITVTVSGLALSGVAAGNYVLSATSAAAPIGGIAQAVLTAGLTGTVTKTYNGTTAANLAAGNYTLSGVFGTDAVTLNDPASGTYATANAGTGITVTVTGLSLSGAAAGNYVVNATAAAPIGTVAPATLTAGLSGTVSKTYGATTLATLAPDNYTLAGVIGNDSVTLNDPATGTYATATAGTAIPVTVAGLALGGAAAANYVLGATSVTAPIGTISRAVLTAGLTGSVSGTYNGTTTATLTPANYTLSGVVGGDAVALNDPATGSYASKNAGGGIAVTVSGLALTGAAANDYTLAAGTASAPIGTIAPAIVTVSLTGTAAATSGTTATLTAANYVLTGVATGDTVTLNDPTTATYASGTQGGITVTVTGLTLGGAQASDYRLPATSVTATIAAAAVSPPVVTPPIVRPPILTPPIVAMQVTPAQPIPPTAPLPVLASLPQQGVASAGNALLLVAGNGFGPLPAIISAGDAAGTIMLPDGIAISTGLPLLVGAEQSLVMTDGDRHLIIRLPAPTMPAPSVSHQGPGGAP